MNTLILDANRKGKKKSLNDASISFAVELVKDFYSLYSFQILHILHD
jgi:hypothetical protein